MKRRILALAAILSLLAATPAFAVTAQHFQNLTTFNNTIDVTSPPNCNGNEVLTFIDGNYVCVPNFQPSCGPGQTLDSINADGTRHCVSNAAPSGCPDNEGVKGFNPDGTVTGCLLLQAVPTPPTCSAETTIVTAGGGSTDCKFISNMETDTIPNIRTMSQNGWCTLSGATYMGSPAGYSGPPMTGHIMQLFCSCRGLCHSRGYGEGFATVVAFNNMGCTCVR